MGVSAYKAYKNDPKRAQMAQDKIESEFPQYLKMWTTGYYDGERFDKQSVKKTDESLEKYVDGGVCPKCGGEMVSEELITEKQDACYHKVKSRYKIWPSAYASGALVKCRKAGAANWGNKSKK
jgi:siroheme synthase (precorrin-2 oxidase/ferrochelatase)